MAPRQCLSRYCAGEPDSEIFEKRVFLLPKLVQWSECSQKIVRIQNPKPKGLCVRGDMGRLGKHYGIPTPQSAESRNLRSYNNF
jgi:hypothetical protein